MTKRISQLDETTAISNNPSRIIFPISNTASGVTYSVALSTINNFTSLKPNLAFTHANSAFSFANTTSNVAVTSFIQANAAFIQANTPSHVANSSALYANGAFLQANTPSHVANSAALYANGAFAKANLAATVMPQVLLENTEYTLAVGDSGKHVYYIGDTDINLYIPDDGNAGFSTGAYITLISQSVTSANLTIVPETDVELFLAGDDVSAQRNLTSYGVATMYKVASNTWFIQGTGVVPYEA